MKYLQAWRHQFVHVRSLCACTDNCLMYVHAKKHHFVTYVSVRRKLCTVCNCLDTPVGAQTRSMQMCKRLYNVCPCLENSVCAPPKIVYMSRWQFKVFHCSKMSVYDDSSTVRMLSGCVSSGGAPTLLAHRRSW